MSREAETRKAEFLSEGKTCKVMHSESLRAKERKTCIVLPLNSQQREPSFKTHDPQYASVLNEEKVPNFT